MTSQFVRADQPPQLSDEEDKKEKNKRSKGIQRITELYFEQQNDIEESGEPRQIESFSDETGERKKNKSFSLVNKVPNIGFIENINQRDSNKLRPSGFQIQQKDNPFDNQSENSDVYTSFRSSQNIGFTAAAQIQINETANTFRSEAVKPR